jgi:hypothetical protein
MSTSRETPCIVDIEGAATRFGDIQVAVLPNRVEYRRHKKITACEQQNAIECVLFVL